MIVYMSNNTPKRHTVQLPDYDWQWLVDERARTGKSHKAITHDLIESETDRRALTVLSMMHGTNRKDETK